MHPLVICIGNIARGDDGAAHRVATLLAARLPRNVRLRTARALDVDMAEEAADAGNVVIVDAERRTEPAVAVRPVEPAPAGEYGHALEPGHLLDIAWALYSARPKMTLVTVAAPEMGHTETLSPTAERAAEEAAEVVLGLLGL
jgi:hydrogenase maturation protease